MPVVSSTRSSFHGPHRKRPSRTRNGVDRAHSRGHSNSTSRLELLHGKLIEDGYRGPDDTVDAKRVNEKESVTNQHILPADVNKNRNDHPSEDATAIPNPIPDPGIRPTQAHGYPSTPPRPTLTTHMAPALASALHVSGFSALPPLLSTGPPITVTMVSISHTKTAFSSSASGLDQTNATATTSAQHSTVQPHKLSTIVITLLAVGAGCLLLGIFIIIKFCSRPARRPRPTPSRPILDDAFAEDTRFEKESPIFGGKERLSPRPGSNGAPWTWTQYPQPGLGVFPPEQAAIPSDIGGMAGHGAVPRSSHLRGRMSSGNGQYHFTGHGRSQSAFTQTPANSPYQAPLKHVQDAITSTVDRFSMTSMSMYPASPQTVHSDIGVAIDGTGPVTTFTADGGHPINGTKSKAKLPRESSCKRYSQALAYDGADVSSPTITSHLAVPIVASTFSTSTSGGRTRIKSSYYAPGSYPRMSTAQPWFASRASNPMLFETQPVPPIQKSESRRDRDTRALGQALGLSSPSTCGTSSPQPTLYPDDSLSVVDAKIPRKQSHKKPANQPTYTLPTMTPPMDTSAALGNLMLVDFSTGVKESMTSGTLSGLPSSKIPSATKKGRSDDKPPRVPSPPPLPSLAQMGLEHANPEAYADYRSPTYSIYGLYDADRKSRS